MHTVQMQRLQCQWSTYSLRLQHNLQCLLAYLTGVPCHVRLAGGFSLTAADLA